MSWPVRSKLLGTYLATPAANTLTSLGTVPSGKTWLLKEWTVYNAGAGARSFFLWLSIGATHHVIAVVASLAAGAAAGEATRHTVLPAGSQLQFSTSTATSIHVTASGAQLG